MLLIKENSWYHCASGEHMLILKTGLFKDGLLEMELIYRRFDDSIIYKKRIYSNIQEIRNALYKFNWKNINSIVIQNDFPNEAELFNVLEKQWVIHVRRLKIFKIVRRIEEKRYQDFLKQ